MEEDIGRLQLLIWSVLPIIIMSTFTILLINVVLCNKPLNNLRKILLLFTGGSLLFSSVKLLISWPLWTISGECHAYETYAIGELYTLDILITGAIFLGILGALKLYETIKSKE